MLIRILKNFFRMYVLGDGPHRLNCGCSKKLNGEFVGLGYPNPRKILYINKAQNRNLLDRYHNYQLYTWHPIAKIRSFLRHPGTTYKVL